MNAHSERMARIECRVDGDPRLIAGAAMIAAHVARRAGLADAVASGIAEAAVQACGALLEAMEGTGPRTIRLAASELPDRIEVSFEPVLRGSGAREKSPEQSLHLTDRVRQILKATADGVTVEFQEGSPRITLVKNCGAAKHPFAV